ncbi:hypothetical protein [[Mycoplasma] gypis]|uniref:hypothetical protein n=1 Tax=[Mycoplasma] gypis TaxID=92404 RepID=UPI0019688336|nr:hypothetical protein [[Mycoplasma] gypis]MBN0919416.1 hypothetical protein [[Mycoplasma] gypis]
MQIQLRLWAGIIVLDAKRIDRLTDPKSGLFFNINYSNLENKNEFSFEATQTVERKNRNSITIIFVLTFRSDDNNCLRFLKPRKI